VGNTSLKRGVNETWIATTSYRRLLRVLVAESKFVAEDIEAGDAVFAFFVVPLALATFFAVNEFAFTRNGAGKFDAEIKVAANAFPIRTVETENRFGVFEIGFVFHAAVASDAFGVEVLEVNGE
jgi:hypothetical protein